MKRFLVVLSAIMFFIFIGAGQKAWANDNAVDREITSTTYGDGSVRITDTMGDRVIIIRIRHNEVCDADEIDEVGFALMTAYLDAQSAKFAGDMNQRISGLQLVR